MQFKPLESAKLPRALPDVDITVINTNYALSANLNPAETLCSSRIANRRT